MHLLARSQGVTTLATTFHDDAFIRQEVEQMCEWLETYSANTPSRTDKRLQFLHGKE